MTSRESFKERLKKGTVELLGLIMVVGAVYTVLLLFSFDLYKGKEIEMAFLMAIALRVYEDRT